MSVLTLSKTEIAPGIEIEKRPLRGFTRLDVPAHRHANYYELEFILSGKCIYSVNEAAYEANSGFLFFATPLDVHSVDALGNVINVYNVSFSESSILPEYQNILFNTQIRCAYFKDTEKIITLFELLLSEVKNTSDHFTGNNKNYLLNLIIAEFIRMAKIDDSHPRLSLIQDIVRYTRIHISEAITLESVAGVFNISPQHLSRLFKQSTGTNFKRYIIDLRLDLAKNLLTRTDMAVTNICYDTGFSSIGNFLRRFKEKYGATPTQYRQRYTNKQDG